MKIMLVLGTRPEIIKLSIIIELLKKEGFNYFLVHTNQHYSKEMSKIFFRGLKIKLPDYKLSVNKKSEIKQISKIIINLESIIIKEKPTHLIVQGDTNSALAGAIAGYKMKLKVCHIEAGLRSHDLEMPEEVNRILIDHLSDYLFVPTSVSKDNLLQEGINRNRIFLVGNTIVDVLNKNMKLSAKSRFLERFKLKKKEYLLLTIHRQSNVDNKSRISNIILGLKELSEYLKMPIIWPIHPRARKRILSFKINLPININPIEPLNFFDFLSAEKNSKLVLTDSGGVQEECCILKVPCITLRDNTERPETIVCRSNILAGTNPNKIFNITKEMMGHKNNWNNPFGDGKSSQRIISILKLLNNLNS